MVRIATLRLVRIRLTDGEDVKLIVSIVHFRYPGATPPPHLDGSMRKKGLGGFVVVVLQAC